MSTAAPVTYAADADRVGWIVFGDPDARVNIFNEATLAALADAITAAERDAPRAVVLCSANERIFIAGADLRVLAAMPDAAAAMEFSRTGQRLFQRVADFPVPVVGAIHGACAGGGFELALACHWRIATDAAVTQIGLPETSIGTIPGWGGCVRLPRLIGVKPALEHILKGQLLGASEALSTGLVHELVPPAEMRVRAKAQALKLAAHGHPPHAVRAAAVPEALERMRETVMARTRGHQPALLAAIDVVARTESRPLTEGLEIEARSFGEVTAGQTCKNLIRVFLLRDAAKKRTLEGWFEPSVRDDSRSSTAAQPGSVAGESGDIVGAARSREEMRRVGVVGAGVMGSGIAHWLAARGFDVVLRDMEPALVEGGLTVIRSLFDEAVKRGRATAGEANAGLHRIAAGTDWNGFESCDLVIEAIVENAAAKRALFSELAGIVPADALLASNTSALPIEEIAGHVANPARTLGIHFFNPVSRMALVELILGRHTSAAAAGRALAFVRKLGKTPVICRSSPGFLVTRVLFFYLNEAVRLWESGAGTREIDGAMREFGWPMGPLRLIDEVGVDVTDFIFGEMAHYFPGRMERANACGPLLAAGLKGRKNGASRGFYRYEGGREIENDTETRALAGTRAAERAPADIADRLMHVMVEEANHCLEEGVVKSADDVDFALLTGAGFPAFRGGLLHWARSHATP